MKKKLWLIFLNEDGSKEKIIIHHVAQNLSPQKVYQKMKQITELELFEKDGLKLMTKVYAALYVGRKEQQLFRLETEAELNEFIASVEIITDPISLLKWVITLVIHDSNLRRLACRLAAFFLFWQRLVKRRQVSFAILESQFLL